MPGAIERLVADLEWLGIDFDEGVNDRGPSESYRQSRRIDLHLSAVNNLLTSGNAYHCWCTPDRLEGLRIAAASRQEPPRYDRRCLTDKQHTDLLPVIRFKIDRTRRYVVPDLFFGDVVFEGAHLDDPIILRSDGTPTSLLAGVVDDQTMGVTHIVRGEEWLASTPYQLAIFDALDYPLPRWGHLAMLLGQDGKKLSKRTPGISVGEIRATGIQPESLNRYLAGLGRETFSPDRGWSMEDLAADFDPSHYRAGGAMFTITGLQSENGALLRRLTKEELWKRFGDSLLVEFPELQSWMVSKCETAVELAAEEAKGLAEITRDLAPFVSQPLLAAGWESSFSDARSVLETGVLLWREHTVDDWAPEEWLKAVAATTKLKGRDLYQPIRIALTGQTHGPQLPKIIALLGRETAVSRLQQALETLL